MNELEKILEEIKEVFEQNIVKEFNGDGTVDKYTLNPWHTLGDIKKVIRKHMNDTKCGDCSRRKWYQKGFKDGSKDNDDWIPVEERLPEEKVNPRSQDFYEYQVTAKFGNVKDVRHYKYGNGHWWHGPGIADKYVIAWRENPDPNRPGRKGK